MPTASTSLASRASRSLAPARALLLPLALCLALSGCGGGGSNGDGGSATSTPSAPPSVSAALPNGLTATLAEDRATIPVGGSVAYTVTVSNPTAQPITFQAFQGNTDNSTPLAAYFIIRDSNGTVVFPTGTGPAGTGLPGPGVTLGTGQSVRATLVTLPGDIFTQSGVDTATANLVIYTGPTTTALSPSQAQSTTLGPLPVTVQ